MGGFLGEGGLWRFFVRGIRDVFAILYDLDDSEDDPAPTFDSELQEHNFGRARLFGGAELPCG